MFLCISGPFLSMFSEQRSDPTWIKRAFLYQLGVTGRVFQSHLGGRPSDTWGGCARPPCAPQDLQKGLIPETGSAFWRPLAGSSGCIQEIRRRPTHRFYYLQVYVLIEGGLGTDPLQISRSNLDYENTLYIAN